MRSRRSSLTYRNEMSRMIDQFSPGTRVLCMYNNVDNGVIGIVESVNSVENKVYVAWNAGPVKQHDPDELLVAAKPVENVKNESRQVQDVVKDNPTVGIPDSTGMEKVSSRRMAGRVITASAKQAHVFLNSNPPMENFKGDPSVHGLDDPRGGGFKVITKLVEDLREEQQSKQAELNTRHSSYDKKPEAKTIESSDFKFNAEMVTEDDFANSRRPINIVVNSASVISEIKPDFNVVKKDVVEPTKASIDISKLGHVEEVEVKHDVLPQQSFSSMSRCASGIGRRKVAVYHSERGRVYRRTRRERDEQIMVCPKCRAEMELRPFTMSEKIYVCPACDWKITSSKVQ